MTAPAWLDRGAWPHEGRQHASPDGSMHYIDEGSGPPVVFVHGTPTWSFEWRHAIAALSSTHRAIAVDHLGFGLSARPMRASYTPEAHASRFGHFIEARRSAADRPLEEPIVLVVHDFGGPIALDWALDHVHALRGIIVVNTFMWSFTDDPVMSRRIRLVDNAVGRWLYRTMNASLKLLMPSAYADRRQLTPAIHAQYLAPFRDADSRERVLFALAQSLQRSAPFFDALYARRDRMSKVPMGIIWGAADHAFDRSQLQRWQALAPHATVYELADAGHWPHEEQPSQFTAALRAILTSDSFRHD